MKYKVVIVDDHKIFRDGFKLALEAVNNAIYIGEATNGKELLELLKKKTPDIVFVDVNMPVMGGYDAVINSLQKYPDLKFIALTSFGDIDSVKKMVHAGVEGYMLKNAELEEIEKAINNVMNGKNYFNDDVLFQLTKKTMNDLNSDKDDNNETELSDRESEVLELLCEGLSVAEISDKLKISNRTVEKHKENLMLKSQTKNTVNLILWALKSHIISI